MTRRLGVRYIWIDALCIIQEDQQDWLKEAPQMHTIYENAYLTLAATASSDGTGGCYRSIPQEAHERRFVYGTQSQGTHTVYVREAIQHFEYLNSQEVRSKEFPLLERAWVYQEQVLSSRMLHFCNFELSFECKEDAHCECEEGPSDGSTNKVRLHKILQAKNRKASIVWEWPEFVEDYTALKMTYDNDRLPALSSIARKIAQLNPGDCYLAGMWKSTLLESLLWFIEYGKVQRHRPAKPRAPSWSWASAFGSISWEYCKIDLHELEQNVVPDTRTEFHAKILKAECNPVDGDPFGCIGSGVITISGKITPCLLTWSTSGEVDPQEPGWKIAAFDNMPFNKYFDEMGAHHFQVMADYLFNLDAPGCLDVFCLWLCRKGPYNEWFGLVLQKVGHNTFERIAHFEIALESNYAPWDIIEATDFTGDII